MPSLRAATGGAVRSNFGTRMKVEAGSLAGSAQGEMANLATQYLLDIEEQGYALVTCELAVFKPEA
jgi:hypothetical protein